MMRTSRPRHLRLRARVGLGLGLDVRGRAGRVIRVELGVVGMVGGCI